MSTSTLRARKNEKDTIECREWHNNKPCTHDIFLYSGVGGKYIGSRRASNVGVTWDNQGGVHSDHPEKPEYFPKSIPAKIVEYIAREGIAYAIDGVWRNNLLTPYESRMCGLPKQREI